MRKQPATTAWLPWSSACQSPEGRPLGTDPGVGSEGRKGGGIFPEAPKLDLSPQTFPPANTQLSGFSEGKGMVPTPQV